MYVYVRWLQRWWGEERFNLSAKKMKKKKASHNLHFAPETRACNTPSKKSIKNSKKSTFAYVEKKNTNLVPVFGRAALRLGRGVVVTLPLDLLLRQLIQGLLTGATGATPPPQAIPDI